MTIHKPQGLVTPEDREAAADLMFLAFKSEGMPDRTAEAMNMPVRQGRLDHCHEVQAFARHREQATAELVEAIEQARGHISGGLCYFTADAKHAQLVDADKVLEAALAKAAPPAGDGA